MRFIYLLALVPGLALAQASNGGGACGANMTCAPTAMNPTAASGNVAIDLITGAEICLRNDTTANSCFYYSGGGVFNNQLTVDTLFTSGLTNNKIRCVGTTCAVVADGTVQAQGNLLVPVIHGSATVQQAIESGTKVLAAGAGTVTFGTAFSASPICTCTDQTSAAATKCSTSTTTLTIAGTSTDTIAYICIGAY